MNKKLILTGLFALSLVACGSSNEEDPGVPGCGSGGDPIFNISGFDINLYQGEVDLYSPVLENEITTPDPVDSELFVISLQALSKTQAARQMKSKGFSFSLMSKAYACSPVPPYTEDKIIDLQITSTADFNNDLPSGSSLNGVFDISYMTYTDSSYFSSKDGTRDYFSVDEFLAQEEPQAADIMQLRFNTTPEYKDNHVFYIRIELDTGEVIDLETQELNFL